MFLVLVMMTVAVAACGKSGNKESSKNKNGEETETEEAKPVYQFTIWGSKADLSDEKGSWLRKSGKEDGRKPRESTGYFYF